MEIYLFHVKNNKVNFNMLQLNYTYTKYRFEIKVRINEKINNFSFYYTNQLYGIHRA